MRYIKRIKLSDDTYNIFDEEAARIDSPALTGTPTAPTPDFEDNSTRIATTAYMKHFLGEMADVAFSGDYNDLSNKPASDTEAYQKSMLQYFQYVAEQDPGAQTYVDNLRKGILNLDEFKKLGSGLFIHWGVYSVPAGHYDGTKQPGSTVTATDISYNTEWSLRDLGIPLDVYKAYETQFTGENFDPDSICKMASELGMKYIILTVKHHEGFCLAPTTAGDWDIRSATCRDTIVDELKAACDKYYLKFCIYYSQYWDWMAVGGFGLDHGKKWTTTDPYTATEHISYCKTAIAQIKELVDKYHPYTLWYDPGTSYSTTYVDMFKDAEQDEYPNVITNDRLEYNRTYGDFGTGERTIYLRSLPYGESCFTLNNTWGYSVNNETQISYYTLEKILKQFMLYTVSYGQNCVLNIGPKPDGSLPTLTQDRLDSLKSFIDDYATGGFYNYTRMSTLSRPKWGYMIGMPNNKVMCYVVVKGNTNYQNIILDGVDTTMLAEDGVKILTPGTNPSYTILDNYRIQITGLALDSASKIGVIELDYQSEPIKVDATTATNNELITSRVFPVVSTTYDFSKCIHVLSGSSTIELNTELIWLSGDALATIELDYTLQSPEATYDLNTVIDVEDLDDGSTGSFHYASNATTTEDKFNFINGHKYQITYKFTGSVNNKFDFNGFTIKYNEHEDVTGVTISPKTADIPQGGSVQLSAEVIPAYATDKSVTWSSSNTDVATVNSTGLVTATNVKGTTTITVTTNDGGFTDTCVVTVKDISVTGVSFTNKTMSLYQAQTEQLTYTITPTNAGNQNVTFTTSDPDLITVTDDGMVAVQDDAIGSAVITITTEDGGYTDTCTITILEETYYYKFEAQSLDGSATQGEDTGIKLFSDTMPNWTIFGYVHNSKNPNTDSNATLYQIVVNSSPWTGLRIDADNNNYPSASTPYSPLVPRFLASSDHYINPITGADTSSKPKVDPALDKHPVCFSRNGTVYKYSIDGIQWTEISNLSSDQLTRLKDCILTVGFDYRRSGGTITTNKYRLLKTDNPCCVAINNTSEYPFYKLYKKYDASR